MYTYNQSTGLLIDRNGTTVATCYSGNGNGRNNPMYQNVMNVGPIPRGIYTIGPPYDHSRLGPGCLNLNSLTPLVNKRGGFLIHGDNKTNDASEGCIIMSKSARAQIAMGLSYDNLLEVL